MRRLRRTMIRCKSTERREDAKEIMHDNYIYVIIRGTKRAMKKNHFSLNLPP